MYFYPYFPHMLSDFDVVRYKKCARNAVGVFVCGRIFDLRCLQHLRLCENNSSLN